MTGAPILALSGGVGGAKLALGLADCLGSRLVVACNTGDDFEHLGLHVSPDLDTVLYTLAGIANPDTGWGRAGESWRFMEALADLGGPDWFQLGDSDLALNVLRTARLRDGAPLSAIAGDVAGRLGIAATVSPVTDAPLRTRVETDRGLLDFQDYFVRLKPQPQVRGLHYVGADTAALAPPLAAAVAAPGLGGIILCPSNPFLSLGPMLAMPALSDALASRRAPAIAVSPIIGGSAVKGPTAKIMAELGHAVSALSVARLLRPLIDGFVLDHADAGQAPEIEAMGLAVHVTRTLMTDRVAKQRLAAESLDFAARLAAPAQRRIACAS